jgi:tetratricopeptide (TPR) repeat protein
LCGAGLFAQQQPPPDPAQQPQKKLETTRPAKPVEQEPPEEDESLKPEEFSLNPLEAQRNITTGDYYFKKKNYHAAARRYLRATKWDPGSSEAFLKLGETEEKLNEHGAAREAYETYLQLAPAAKNAAAIQKKIEKWPVTATK